MSASPRGQSVTTLRRQILESALKGQQRQQVAREELGRQDEQLRQSLGATDDVLRQTADTRDVVDVLTQEAQSSRWQQTQRCLWYYICCKRNVYETNSNLKRTIVDRSSELLAKLKSKSPADWTEDATEADILYHLDRFDRDREKRRTQGQKERDQTWKRTLAPPPGDVGFKANNANTQVWHRQVDLSLQQLQQVAEEMGKSLEEQKRLAQTLTIYLEYGVDQVMGINESLAIDKIN